jgi:hypothetical protein
MLWTLTLGSFIFDIILCESRSLGLQDRQGAWRSYNMIV